MGQITPTVVMYEEDTSLVHDEETMEVINFEAEELSFGQAEEIGTDYADSCHSKSDDSETQKVSKAEQKTNLNAPKGCEAKSLLTKENATNNSSKRIYDLFFLKEDTSLVHDEETVEVINLEAEELNFGQTEETTDLMTAEEMTDFMEFEYLLDEAEVEN
uniref:Uncharacterized protein n=1 Tax=Acrobeloides nanus TaxID=290746 RepID=A0A914D615_9BILA